MKVVFLVMPGVPITSFCKDTLLFYASPLCIG